MYTRPWCCSVFQRLEAGEEVGNFKQEFAWHHWIAETRPLEGQNLKTTGAVGKDYSEVTQDRVVRAL